MRARPSACSRCAPAPPSPAASPERCCRARSRTRFGTETLIVLEALLLGVVGVLVVTIARTTTIRVPPRRRDRSVVADLRLGFDTVARSPLMRLVAVAYVLLAILAFSVTYPFLLAASDTFHSEADLATFLGLLSAATTATSFVVSLALANRVYARFGVAGAALLLPIVYLGGFGLWLVAFSISTAAIFRFAQQVTQRGVSNAAWSAFYNVVPRERRAQVLAFNDGVPGQVGTILSGLLLLAAGSLFARDQVFWLGALTALLCALVVAGIRRRYGASVLDSLRAGLGEQVLEGGPGLGALTRDPTATDTLIGALRSDEPGVRRMAADLLGRTSVERAGPVLIRTVDDDADPTVRAAALQALGRLGGPPPAMAAAVACLADPDPGVRAAAIRAVGALSADPDGDARDAAAGRRSDRRSGPGGQGRHRLPVRGGRAGPALGNDHRRPHERPGRRGSGSPVWARSGDSASRCRSSGSRAVSAIRRPTFASRRSGRSPSQPTRTGPIPPCWRHSTMTQPSCGRRQRRPCRSGRRHRPASWTCSRPDPDGPRLPPSEPSVATVPRSEGRSSTGPSPGSTARPTSDRRAGRSRWTPGRHPVPSPTS